MMKLKHMMLVSIALFINSCSDVLIEDHIAGRWELKSYARNGTNETSEIKISYYEETYALDGIYSRLYVDGKQHLVEETGKFAINEDDWTMHISDISSIADFSNNNSTLSTSTVKVVTIDDSEFSYSFENGGDTHEFRFMKKE